MKAIGVVCLLFVVVVLGCEDETPCIVDCAPLGQRYLAQTSPENVVHNLELSYRHREATEYAKLLHPDFIFVFQQADVQEIGTEFWTRDQDTTQTKNLFEAINVTRILIDLTYAPAMPIAPGSDTLFIRVNPTYLEVDELGEGGVTTTYTVNGDIQDMFFVQGEDADSTKWYLLNWRDIPGVSISSSLLSPGLACDCVSWGKIKAAKYGS